MKLRLTTTVMIAALAVTTCKLAGAQGVPCSLENATYSTAGLTAAFQIDVNCATAKSPRAYPAGRPLVVGLTLYAVQKISNRPEIFPSEGATSERKVVEKENGSKKQRGFVRDEEASAYDFALKDVIVKGAGFRQSLKFEAPTEAIEKYAYFVFAVWPKSEVAACKKDKYARSGCQRYGYVVGKSADVAPVDFYPGFEVTSYVHPAGDWTSERWLVERFR